MTDVQPTIVVAIEPVLVDFSVAARMLGGISERKLQDLVRDGRLGAQTIDKRVVFSVDELRRFATDCPAWEPSR